MAEQQDDIGSLATIFTFVPPTGTKIQEGSTVSGSIKIPSYRNSKIYLVPLGSEPNLRINNGPAAELTLNGQGESPFQLSFTYPSSVSIRPDVSVTIQAQNAAKQNIPDVEVAYEFIVRDTYATPEGRDFAVIGGELLKLNMPVVNGVGDLVGGANVTLTCAEGNVIFYDLNGTDITKTNADTGALYALVSTDNTAGDEGFGIANAQVDSRAAGIFDLSVQLEGSNAAREFTAVVADDRVIGGSLPAARTSFSNTLNLGGAATTFMQLAQELSEFPPSAKIVVMINGNPVAPYDLTVSDFFTSGYELPKVWFQKTTIDGADPKGNAKLYYMVQSTDDDPNRTRSIVKQVSYTGTVINAPLSGVTRKLPTPSLSGISVVNHTAIMGNVLDVTIDFTNAGVAAGLDAWITLYANGYSSNSSTTIDNVQTITQKFKTVDTGPVVVPVDATLLWGFTSSAKFQPSNLKIDYYVVTPAAAVAQLDPSGEYLDPAQRDLGKQYSAFLAKGWQINTPM